MDESSCGARVKACTRAQTGNGRYVGLSDHLGTVVDEASGKNYASTSLRDGNESCERILTSTMQMIHGSSEKDEKDWPGSGADRCLRPPGPPKITPPWHCPSGKHCRTPGLVKISVLGGFSKVKYSVDSNGIKLPLNFHDLLPAGLLLDKLPTVQEMNRH